MSHPAELQLTRAIAEGDAAAWNTFVQRYGDLVMSAVIGWLEADYRVPRSQYTSILRSVTGNLPEPADEADIDREGLALYRWVLEQLKPRLAGYQGVCSLGAYLRLELRTLRHRYLTAELGKLTLPRAIAELPSLAQDVYRLSARVGSPAEIARRLGVDEAQVAEAEKTVRQALQAAGKEWWSLEAWPLAAGEDGDDACPQGETIAALHERRLAEPEAKEAEAHRDSCPQCQARWAFLDEAAAKGGIAPPVHVPAWVNRDVVVKDPSGAPDPTAVGATFTQKVLSQPQWLAGVALGLIASAVALVFIIPRLEYGKVLRAPSDQAIARADAPLSAEAAKDLAEARTALVKGKIDLALRDLQSVLLVRPDNLEARWLLANTYDRLGDATKAAKHYEIFLEESEQRKAALDARTQSARVRLETMREMP